MNPDPLAVRACDCGSCSVNGDEPSGIWNWKNRWISGGTFGLDRRWRLALGCASRSAMIETTAGVTRAATVLKSAGVPATAGLGTIGASDCASARLVKCMPDANTAPAMNAAAAMAALRGRGKCGDMTPLLMKGVHQVRPSFFAKGFRPAAPEH